MKNKTKLIQGILLLLFCMLLSGCTSLKSAIENYSSDKAACELDRDSVTRFTYGAQSYTILEETVSNGSLGQWVGYIRRLAAVDENGRVLIQENIEEASFQSLTDLTERAPDTAYIISFLNVYAAPNDASCLIVDVDGAYHKAVPSNTITETDEIFDFTVQKETNGMFEINPENATQLLCGDKIYQVTSEVVPNEHLSGYLDILAENVTFDTETKRPLTKEELNKIDWSGSGTQNRENWFYVDVYEISGEDTAQVVAVQVNNQYYLAKAQ